MEFPISPLLFDGDMQSALQDRGLLAAGEAPERLNLTRPLDILDVHMAYGNAGANILSSNTFGALRLLPLRAENREAVQSGVALCREAAESLKKAGKANVYAAAAFGPMGLRPDMGPETIRRAYEAASSVFSEAADAGADLLLIETMSDLFEARLLLLAARAATRLPVLVSFTLEPDDFTFAGNSPDSAALCCGRLGAAMVGVNCGQGPEGLFSGFSRLMGASPLPVFARPDARLPGAIRSMPPADFAKAMLPYLQSGAHGVGGCCGAGPAHIEALSPFLPEARGLARKPRPVDGFLASPRRRVSLDAAESARPIPLSDLGPEDAERAVAEAAKGADVLALDLCDLAPEAVECLILNALPALQQAALKLHVRSAAQAEAALFLYPGVAAVLAEGDAYRVLKSAARYGAEVLS